MIIVLDTSVLIAAFAARGLCQALFEHCLENHEIYMCRQMREDLRRCLVDDIKVPSKIAAEIESFLKIDPWPLQPAPVEPGICRDRKTLLVLGIARAAKAQYIISGDPDLRALKEYRGAKIVDPRSFWDIMKNSQPQ